MFGTKVAAANSLVVLLAELAWITSETVLPSIPVLPTAPVTAPP